MESNTWFNLVQEGFNTTLKTMDFKDISGFAQRIQKSRRTFLMGSGRTGLVVEMFAMRLIQLGLPVHVVSQPTTPAIEKDDLLILVSGSGETVSILSAASKSKEIGTKTLAVTQNEESSLGKFVQDRLIIHSPHQISKVLNGSLFEMALLITFDAVVAELLNLTGQDFLDMSKRHANIG